MAERDGSELARNRSVESVQQDALIALYSEHVGLYRQFDNMRWQLTAGAVGLVGAFTAAAAILGKSEADSGIRGVAAFASGIGLILISLFFALFAHAFDRIVRGQDVTAEAMAKIEGVLLPEHLTDVETFGRWRAPVIKEHRCRGRRGMRWFMIGLLWVGFALFLSLGISCLCRV